MKSRRPIRFLSALVALFGMLFMQLALAGYACETKASRLTASAGVVAAPSAYATPDCTGLDAEQAALCSAHAQTGNQSFDKPASPGIPQFIPAVLTAVSDSSRAALMPIIPQQEGPALARSIAPSLSISNCCFRN